MHILIIPSWYVTGDNPISGVFFREQALALKRSGYTIGVIAPVLRSLRQLRKGVPQGTSRFTLEDDEGMPTYREHAWAWLPRVPYGNSTLWLRAGERLFKRYLANHGMPDLIHAHSVWVAGVLAARLKQHYGIPFVVTEHSTAYARGMIRPWQYPLIRGSLEAAAGRIVVSPPLGHLMESQFVGAMKPWVWIPNIVDKRFCSPLGTEDKRGKIKAFRFLNVALLTEKKGHRNLLSAFAGRFKGDAKVQLRIGGDGPIRLQLERLTKELGIEQQVHFLGMLDRDKVVQEMLAADAFVLSSHYETFGVVLIEALACGKPVVATACGGPECIINGTNGILVPPRDIDALGGALHRLRTNILEYKPDAIRADCIRRFGEVAVVTQLEQLYKSIAVKP